MSIPKKTKLARERSPVDLFSETKPKRRRVDEWNDIAQDSLKKRDKIIKDERIQNLFSLSNKPKVELKKKASTLGKRSKKEIEESKGGCSSLCSDTTAGHDEDVQLNNASLSQPTTLKDEDIQSLFSLPKKAKVELEKKASTLGKRSKKEIEESKVSQDTTASRDEDIQFNKCNNTAQDSLKKKDESLKEEDIQSLSSLPKKAKVESKKKATTLGKGSKKEIEKFEVNCCQDTTASHDEDAQISNASSSQPTTSKATSIQMKWKDDELLAEIEDLDRHIARNVIKLFDDDNTIPFIARYRKDMTGGMDPDKLRKVKQSYDSVKSIIHKAQNIVKQASAQGKLNEDLTNSICSARSLAELDSISSQFKTGSKRTLAERAKALGLEDPGKKIFLGTEAVDILSLICSDVDGLQNDKKIEEGLKHIIAEMISKHEDVLLGVKKIYKSTHAIKLESTGKKIDNGSPRAEKISKYDLYLNFQAPVKFLKSHQILAINRAESQKLLTVKIIIPDSMWENLKNDCCGKWLGRGIAFPLRTKLVLESFDDAVHRLISPMVIRHIRSQLAEFAESESLNVFSQNLRNLLLTRPLRGKVVCAIDPGFKNGCKIAVVSPSGVVQQFMKLFLPQVSKSSDRDAQTFRNMLVAFNCDTIALGNGKGCREAESFLNNLIKRKFFDPLKVRYTIVDEQGISIYSCSSLASEEFPGLDPNFISAVALARKLQDPLSELVKIEPKHLGVGMYQHDVTEKKLVAALDEVVSECVSFVGVDVNTCSIYLLKRVAGLNESKAKNIVDYRLTNGPFRSRFDLKKVKLIGEKTFQQCAGFIRIIPSTANPDELAPVSKNSSNQSAELNPLDRTWIHPESYKVAEGVLNLLDLNLKDLGSDSFIQMAQERMKGMRVEELAENFQIPPVAMKLIVDSFLMSPDHDLRMLSSAPLFREGITTFESLNVGDTLSGVVRNVVHFGAFVDIGVGRDGLIHSSGMKGMTVKLNDKVTVLVVKVVPEKKHVNLQLVSVN